MSLITEVFERIKRKLNKYPHTTRFPKEDSILYGLPFFVSVHNIDNTVEQTAETFQDIFDSHDNILGLRWNCEELAKTKDIESAMVSVRVFFCTK